MIVSGQVSDYTEKHKDAIAKKIGDAHDPKVAKENVAVSIEAASVKITAKVKHDSKAAAEKSASTLKSTLDSKESASAFLNEIEGLENVQVEEDPVHHEVEEVLNGNQQDPGTLDSDIASNQETSESPSLGTGGIVGIVLAGFTVLVLVLAYVLIIRAKKSKRAKGQMATPKAAGLDVPAEKASPEQVEIKVEPMT